MEDDKYIDKNRLFFNDSNLLFKGAILYFKSDPKLARLGNTFKKRILEEARSQWLQRMNAVGKF